MKQPWWRTTISKIFQLHSWGQPPKNSCSESSSEICKTPQNPVATAETSGGFHTCKDLIVPKLKELDPFWTLAWQTSQGKWGEEKKKKKSTHSNNAAIDFK